MHLLKSLPHGIFSSRGGVPERLNGTVSKTVDPLCGVRGFESHPLRQLIIFSEIPAFSENDSRSASILHGIGY